MKELIRIRDVLKDVYEKDSSEAAKYQIMGAGFEELAEYNRGRAAATELAINLIEQHIRFLEKQEATI